MTTPRGTLALATLLAGLSAGFFFAFQFSVTAGLANVDDATYVRTFQEINEAVSNPAFATVFFGAVPAIAVSFALNWRTQNRAGRGLFAVALGLYLVGLAITGIGNVPLNDALGAVTVDSADSAADARLAFEDEWNRFNLLRTLAIGASFALLLTTLTACRSCSPQSSR